MRWNVEHLQQDGRLIKVVLGCTVGVLVKVIGHRWILVSSNKFPYISERKVLNNLCLVELIMMYIISSIAYYLK